MPMFRGDLGRTGELPGPGPDNSNGVEVVWAFAIESEVRSSPAVVDGVLYVGNGAGDLYAVDATDGTEHWRFSADNW